MLSSQERTAPHAFLRPGLVFAVQGGLGSRSRPARCKALRQRQVQLRLELLEDRLVPDGQPVTSNLVLWLNADQGVRTTTSGQVTGWADQSGNSHNGTVSGSGLSLVNNAVNGNNAVRFAGGGELVLSGQVLTSQQYTILALVTDQHTDTGFHEVFSNWTTSNEGGSLFLGTTNQTPTGHGSRTTWAGPRTPIITRRASVPSRIPPCRSSLPVSAPPRMRRSIRIKTSSRTMALPSRRAS